MPFLKAHTHLINVMLSNRVIKQSVELIQKCYYLK